MRDVLDAVERGDHVERYEAQRVHFAAQKYITFEVLVAEVVLDLALERADLEFGRLVAVATAATAVTTAAATATADATAVADAVRY